MPDEFIISKFLWRPEYPVEISTQRATMKMVVVEWKSQPQISTKKMHAFGENTSFQIIILWNWN